MRTGEVASHAGVNIQTLRYYERRGLLPAPARRPGGYRVYGPEAVRTVRFIKRSQRLGFSLDEVASLLELAGGGPDGCDPARKLAGQKLAELDAKIAQLTAMREALQHLLATCDLPRDSRDCTLIRALDPAP